MRDKDKDTRVHACLYFIPPTGQGYVTGHGGCYDVTLRHCVIIVSPVIMNATAESVSARLTLLL